MKPAYVIVKAPCYAFLVYYLIWRKRNFQEGTSSLLKYKKLYSVLLRIVGWIFIIFGFLILLFAFSRILNMGLQEGGSGDWDGVVMSIMGIFLGIVAIKISRRLDSMAPPVPEKTKR